MRLGGVAAWLAGLPAWQGFGLLIAAGLVLAIVVREAGDRYLKRLTDRIDGDVDEIVFGGIHTAVYLTVGLAGASVGTRLYDVSPGIAVPLEAGTLSLVIVVWMVTLLRVGRKASTVVTDSRYIDRQIVPILQNVWSALVAAVGVFLLLVLWNVDVTPLLAAAGVAGIIVGLTARDTLANFFGSLSLSLDGTYKLGDYVVLETGERGRVEDICSRATSSPFARPEGRSVPRCLGALDGHPDPRRYPRDGAQLQTVERRHRQRVYPEDETPHPGAHRRRLRHRHRRPRRAPAGDFRGRRTGERAAQTPRPLP